MTKVIKAEGLSKAYQLGDFGTGTISRDLERFWARMRGKEDPFLKIGETNDRTVKGESNVVWSLKDINFEIEQGDAVGIIGRNGAGKSTLLKILSRVTSPTTGSVKVKGRIASLLEVGTGFHPELTGRENIFLNGAILGMRKSEIKRKFDEIVAFAGVERYIDTPVKRYSSGMYVRLAFAVAAHLESEILIVDEVLAVGDAEFQKKCLGKMGDISKGEGRTVLFVSHNMQAIRRLCSQSIFMANGNINLFDTTTNCIAMYQNSQHYSLGTMIDDNYSLLKINIAQDNPTTLSDILLSFTIKSKSRKKLISIVPLIFNEDNQRIAIMDLRAYIGSNFTFEPEEEYDFSLSIKNCPLMEGEYTLGIYLEDESVSINNLDLFKFYIDTKKGVSSDYDTTVKGFLNLDFSLKLETNNQTIIT